MNNSTHQPMGYVPEIDGLRAIAVLSVMLFHLGIESVSGGFVGVDVFFVISGYLITQIIVKQIEQNTFEFKGFYIRRIRRILPALVFVLVLNLILSFIFLSPELFKESADSTVASVLFSSNILFYFQSGYFDTDAYLKPLLHTWSLGVEEQFYLIWPLVLFFMRNRFSATLFFVFFVGFVVFSEIVARNNPDLGFFIIAFRVHEFMLGAALVVVIKHRTVNNTKLEIINSTGLLLIVYAVLTFKEGTTFFPGVNALIPCLGAALCIYASPAKYSSKLLNHAILVKIGLISFSLYLIHWPLIVYYKYVYNIEVLNVTEMSSIVLVSIVIAYLMYRCIEQPFRLKQHQNNQSNQRFFTWLGIVLLCIITVSVAISSNNGWAWRFKSNMTEVIDKHLLTDQQRQQAIRAPLCHHNKENQPWSQFINSFDQCNEIKNNSILVFGDSHAADLWLGLHLNLPSRNVIQVTGAACRFTNKINRCSEMFEFVENLIKENQGSINSVIYSQRGKFLDTVAIEETQEFLAQLKNENNSVYWFGPQMEYMPSVLTQLSREPSFFDFVKNSAKWQKNELFALDAQLAKILSTSTIQYISKLTSFCTNNHCPIVTPDGVILYVKRAHLTAEGTEYLVKTLLEKLNLKI